MWFALLYSQPYNTPHTHQRTMNTDNLSLAVICIAVFVIFLLCHCSQFNEHNVYDPEGFANMQTSDGPGLNYTADVEQYTLEMHKI